MEQVTGLEAFDEVERLIVVAAHPDDLGTFGGGHPILLRSSSQYSSPAG
jgi:LmbE family N-acetylglucosaminyl deacetylase